MDFLSAGFSSDTHHYFAVSIAQPLGMLTQLVDPGAVLKPLPQLACICVARTLKYKDAKYLTIAIELYVSCFLLDMPSPVYSQQSIL